MAFDSLSEKLQNIFKNLRGKGRLSEADVKAALKEVKLALLEADVNFKVVKQFIKSVEERAIGQDVMSSLTPGQMVIKIVNEEMVSLMGSETTEIVFKYESKLYKIENQMLLDNVAMVHGEVVSKNGDNLFIAFPDNEYNKDYYYFDVNQEFKIGDKVRFFPVLNRANRFYGSPLACLVRKDEA